MSKQLVSGKHRLRNTYWSLVGADGQPEPACGGRGHQLAQTSRCDLDYS